MHAALVGNSECVQQLLDAGYFDPAMRDHTGNAPIHYGAMSGDLDTLGKHLSTSSLRFSLHQAFRTGFRPILAVRFNAGMKNGFDILYNLVTPTLNQYFIFLLLANIWTQKITVRQGLNPF